MRVKGFGFISLSWAVLFGALIAQAQIQPPNTQGYPQVGAPTYSYSALYLDASQFCTAGFNFAMHGCGANGNTGMWEAIAAAINSSQNISGVIDARAFKGTQLVTAGVGTTALYGCSSGGTCANMGQQVNGVLLLGDVTNLCDGPSAGYYTDSATGGGSNYGTPCIIVPWGFQIIGTAPLSSEFTLCTTGTSPCSNAFPKRAYTITGITVISDTQLQYNFSSNPFTTTGGPTGLPLPQNIYPASTSCSTLPTQASGELVAITGAPTGYNFLRTVECATAGSLQIAVPYSTTYTSCSGSCGTAYLVTPLIGFGVQGTSYPYEPVRTGSSQSFGTRLVNLVFDLSTYQGAVAAQNLNGGEQSAMDTIYCTYPSMGCVQVGPGANESGPYNNIYAQNLGNTTNLYPTTFGIYNGSAGAGFHRFTMTLRYSGMMPQPTAAIYDDGSNVVFDSEPHNEGTVDTIDLAPNTSVAGVTVNGITGPPSTSLTGVAGMNLVHVLKDGYAVTGSIFSNLTQQQPQNGNPAGSTYAVADDIDSNNVEDAYLSRYEFDNNGKPVSGATSQTNSSVTTLNGSSVTVIGLAGSASAPAPTAFSVTGGNGFTPSGAGTGTAGGGASIVGGNGGAGGTTGNGGQGGNFTFTTGGGGGATGSTNSGGAGGQFNVTTGNGASGGSSGTSGSGGNALFMMGTGGTTGAPGSTGEFEVMGTQPSANGVSVGTLFEVFPITGGNATTAGNAGGVGSLDAIIAGNGGNGNGSGAGGQGGTITLTTGTGGTAGTSGLGGAGGTFSISVGAGSNGGSISGNGAAGGAANLMTGNGGNANGLSNNGGAGGAFNVTTGIGGNGSVSGSGGNFVVTLGTGGTTGTVGSSGQFTVTGTTPINQTGTGISVGPIFNIPGFSGGPTSSTSGATAGSGSQVSISGGSGGASTGSSGSEFGGTGGTVTIATGVGGGAASGTGGNGGLLSLTAGAGGVATSGTGGAGGGATLSAGNGNGATSGVGGQGGSTTITAGNGGSPVTGTGGAGAQITLTAGTGGASTGSNSGSAGGNIVLNPGAAGMVGTGAVGTPGQVQIFNTLTSTSNVPTLSVNPTWNGGAAVDAALLIDASGTDSADSILIDAKLGLNSEWKVDEGGNVTQAGALTLSGTTTTETTLSTSNTNQTLTLAPSGTGAVNVMNTLTGSSTAPTLSITPSWSSDTGGVVDAALLINPTSGGAAGSLLIDAQANNTSYWKVDKVGNVTQAGNLNASGLVHPGGSLLQQTGGAQGGVSGTCCTAWKSWTLPSLSVLAAYSFTCDLPYVTSGSTAPILGVELSTAPAGTYLFADALIFTGNNPIAVTGGSNHATSTGWTTILQGQPVSTGTTPVQAQLHGTIEIPASTSMTLTIGDGSSNSSTVSFQEGAYCVIF